MTQTTVAGLQSAMRDLESTNASFDNIPTTYPTAPSVRVIADVFKAAVGSSVTRARKMVQGTLAADRSWNDDNFPSLEATSSHEVFQKINAALTELKDADKFNKSIKARKKEVFYVGVVSEQWAKDYIARSEAATEKNVADMNATITAVRTAVSTSLAKIVSTLGTSVQSIGASALAAAQKIVADEDSPDRGSIQRHMTTAENHFRAAGGETYAIASKARLGFLALQEAVRLARSDTFGKELFRAYRYLIHGSVKGMAEATAVAKSLLELFAIAVPTKGQASPDGEAAAGTALFTAKVLLQKAMDETRLDIQHNVDLLIKNGADVDSSRFVASRKEDLRKLISADLALATLLQSFKGKLEI